MNAVSEHNLFIFLVQVFLLLGLARGLGELFGKWKQPALTAEILVGIALGPTILGRCCPALHAWIFPPSIVQKNMFETIALLGLLFFLLETGLKMDFTSAWRHKGAALTIAVADIVVPLALGFGLCLLLPDAVLVDPGRKVFFALFMATVMTISAMPVTIRALNDLNMATTDLGVLIMSALAVNEIIGWLLFTFVLSFISQKHLPVGKTLAVFALTGAFTIACLSAGRAFADSVIFRIKRWNLSEPGSSLTFICLLGIFCGAVYQRIGLHALLGFFIAGVMAGEARALPGRTRQVIAQMVYSIFVPLFFVSIGLRVDFLENFNLWLVLFVVVVGWAGKFLGAWLGGIIARLPVAERLPVAIAHTPGGSMEIVVGALALQHHVINETVFVAIVFAALSSSVLLGPALKFFFERRKEISVIEYFSRSGVVPALKAVQKDSAMYELCVLAAELRGLPDAEALYAHVFKRENLMGTAIEEGVALPHARLEGLNKPLVVFGRSVSGIEWDSPDGKPSRLIFLIITPIDDNGVQIQILRLIAKAMSSEQCRIALEQAGDSPQLWSALHDSLTRQTLSLTSTGA